MKVLAINGSARKDGNTAILINAMFEELNKTGIETEMIQLSNKVIETCKACLACSCGLKSIDGRIQNATARGTEIQDLERVKSFEFFFAI